MLRSFLLVFRHYFMRTLKDPLSILIQIVFPLGIILTFILIQDNVGDDLLGFQDVEIRGYSYLHTMAATSMMLFFQLFGGMWGLTYLYEDLREARRFRLYFAPINRTIYPVAAMLGSWFVSIVQGMLIIVITRIILNPYWANMGIVIVVLLGTALLSHFIFALLFLVTKNLNQANAIGFAGVFAIAALSGALIGDLRQHINHRIIDFLFEWGTPISLGRRAIFESGFMGLDPIEVEADMTLAVRGVIILYVLTAIVAASVYFIADGQRHGD